jgi:hypothetical protein
LEKNVKKSQKISKWGQKSGEEKNCILKFLFLKMQNFIFLFFQFLKKKV